MNCGCECLSLINELAISLIELVVDVINASFIFPDKKFFLSLFFKYNCSSLPTVETRHQAFFSYLPSLLSILRYGL